MTLTAKRRAELRTEAHHLAPSVHVGQQGVTPTLVQSLDDALRARELVKVQLARQGDVKARDAAAALAQAVNADVVQVIGKTTTLYRENPELRRKREHVAGPHIPHAPPSRPNGPPRAPRPARPPARGFTGKPRSTAARSGRRGR